MDEFIIKFLDWLKKQVQDSSKSRATVSSNVKQSKWGMLVKWISFLLVFGSSISAGYAIIVTLIQKYGKSDSSGIFSISTYILDTALPACFLFFLCMIITVHGYHALIRNQEKVARYLYLIFFPFSLATFWLFAWLMFDKSDMPRYDNFTLVSSLLLGVYPILYIFSPYFSFFELKPLQKLRQLFLSYNLGYAFVLALNIAVISLGFRVELLNPMAEAAIQLIRESSRSSFRFQEGLVFLAACFFFLTVWVFTLNTYFKEAGKSRKTLHVWLVALTGVFAMSFLPILLDEFYHMQIGRASTILRQEGHNADGFNKASVAFLDQAFYARIKKGLSIDRTLFSQIYDATPEEYYGEKIAKYTNSRSSFATNSSKVWDSANVILSLAEIENRVNTGSQFPVLETTYRFHFTNISTINQEVILNFEAPTKNSVVSDLKLGLDLELQGQVSPRGAARRVYEESLRKNIDPALIEKVGLNTYTLRVFPIPSKSDQKSQGRQLVELKMLTPIVKNKETVTYSPKFSLINLKFDESSWIISKVYEGARLQKEDIVKKNEIEAYLSSAHSLELGQSNFDLGELCLDEDILSIITRSELPSVTPVVNPSKISVFFDNSLSAQRNGAEKKYGEIYAKLKKSGNDLNDVDLYSYNFDVHKILSTDELKFWWYSDIDRIVEYIINNKIANQRIVLVTDDDSFNFSTTENKTREYASLMSNQISVIKVGKEIKTYKQEINNILSATNGNIYEVSSSQDIEAAVSKILTSDSWKQARFLLCSGEAYNDSTKKIQAGYVSNYLLSMIRSESDWEKIARIQSAVATKYGIVNQFNSFIALQTEQQQRDLDRYNEQAWKFDTTYRNSTTETTSTTAPPRWDDACTGCNIIGFPVEEMGEMPMSTSSKINVGMEGVNMDSRSQGIRVNDWLKGSAGGGLKGVSGDPRPYDYSYDFDWRVRLSFFWILMLMIYLVELYGLVSFWVNYAKGNK